MKETFKEPTSYFKHSNRPTRVILVTCPDNKFYFGLTKDRMKDSVSETLKKKETSLSLHCQKEKFQLKDLTIKEYQKFGSRLRATQFKENCINRFKNNKNLLNKV